MIKAAYRDGAFDPLLVPASISMELHCQASPEDGLEVTAGEPQRLPTAEGRVEGSSKCHQHQEMMVKHGYHLAPARRQPVLRRLHGYRLAPRAGDAEMQRRADPDVRAPNRAGSEMKEVK